LTIKSYFVRKSAANDLRWLCREKTDYSWHYTDFGCHIFESFRDKR